MKKKIIYVLVLILAFAGLEAQVGIGTETPRGMVDVNSPTTNTMGLVLPTNSDAGNIVNPQGGNIAVGTMIYDSTLDCIRVYRSTGWSGCLTFTESEGSFVTGLGCDGVVRNGTLTGGTAATGASFIVGYTGGNGSSYSGQSVSSAGVTGLTADLASGSFAAGDGDLTYSISGTPSASGMALFALNIGGQSCEVQMPVSGLGVVGNSTCTAATISKTSCSAVIGATLNDDPATTGTEYDWPGAAGWVAGGTTRALIEIGGQCWYGRNADNIPSNYTAQADTWAAADNGHSKYYPGGPFTNEGRLYQWKAAMNGSTAERSQGACPAGWHVPSNCEFQALEISLGMTEDQAETLGNRDTGTVGTKLKAGGTSGFLALITGYINNNASGTGSERGISGYFVTSSNTSGTNMTVRRLFTAQSYVAYNNINRIFGVSLRCVKD